MLHTQSAVVVLKYLKKKKEWWWSYLDESINNQSREDGNCTLYTHTHFSVSLEHSILPLSASSSVRLCSLPHFSFKDLLFRLTW